MKPLATITGESGETITISFDGSHIFTESFGEPTMEVGPQFDSETDAAEYIHESWGRNWNLTWIGWGREVFRGVWPAEVTR